MKSISKITKRDIYDLFKYGIDFYEIQIEYPYHGRLEEYDFLKRLYKLEEMPSLDSRYSDAEQDIWQHTVMHNDYDQCWIFEDERFSLKEGDDEEFLTFLCEIFHPEVRIEGASWRNFLDRVNDLLKCDGYELYPARKISGRDVYQWRVFIPDTVFEPFSIRHWGETEYDNLAVCQDARYQIYRAIEHNDQFEDVFGASDYSFYITTVQKLFEELKRFYVPKYYDEKNNYVRTDDLKSFIEHTSSVCVFDAIEVYCRLLNGSADFCNRINVILKRYVPDYRIYNGKIEKNIDHQVVDLQYIQIPEARLQKLLQEAVMYYEDGKLDVAVEKLWGALERLKTYCEEDKKTSVKILIEKMCDGQEEIGQIFEGEFYALTKIGNEFTIRHQERGVVEIKDQWHYEYFYKRCMALISTALKYL